MNTMIRASLTVAVGFAAAAVIPAQSEKGNQQYGSSEAVKVAQRAFDRQDWEAAAKAYAKVVEVDPENARAWHHLGFSLHALERFDEALKAHKKATTFPRVAATATYNIACVHAIRGQKDEAFEWLHKAMEAGFSNAEHIGGDRDMDNLRDDPRYEKFLKALASYTPPVKSYIMTTPRASTRLSFWGKQGSPGQVVIDYGQPAWKDEYADAVDSEKFMNRRWRLGSDFWTTLDTNVTVTIGDAEIAPGQYYLTLEHRDDGKFVLALLDPKEVREQRLDAYLAHLSKGGIEVELARKEIDEPTSELTFGLKVEEGTAGKMWIAFGPHALSAPIAVHLR